MVGALGVVRAVGPELPSGQTSKAFGLEWFAGLKALTVVGALARRQTKAARTLVRFDVHADRPIGAGGVGARHSTYPRGGVT